MEKFSIEINEDQFLIRLERDGYDLPSLYKIIFNLRTELFNPKEYITSESQDDIRSRINDYEDDTTDRLEDK